jgi:hypothetical protein
VSLFRLQHARSGHVEQTFPLNARGRTAQDIEQRQENDVATEVDDLVQSVERSRAAVLEYVALLRDDQGAFKPSANEWSIAEILEHLFHAELGGITKVWAALDELRSGKRWSGELPNRGKRIDEIIDATWRPKEIAPQPATPHWGGPLAAWVTAERSLTHLLRELAVQLEGQSLEAIVFPHFLSGPMDARQRLEFLRFHIDRHFEQVKRVRSHPSFPR